MQIETKRLLLRPLQASDVEPLARLWTDPAVTQFMGGPREYEKVHAMIAEDLDAETPETYDLWPVIEKASGQVIGHCGLLEKDIAGQTEYDVTYVFLKAAWGKGYATEIAAAIRDYAFDELGLKRVIAVIDQENAGSQHVAEKIGMTHWKDDLRSDGITRRIYMLERKAAR